jgi:hypothetical protein
MNNLQTVRSCNNVLLSQKEGQKIQIIDTYVHVHDNLHTDEYQHPQSEGKAIRTRDRNSSHVLSAGVEDFQL